MHDKKAHRPVKYIYMVGKISNDEDAIYHKQTENLVKWCDKNYLHLNVSKTKEMYTDF